MLAPLRVEQRVAYGWFVCGLLEPLVFQSLSVPFCRMSRKTALQTSGWPPHLAGICRQRLSRIINASQSLMQAWVERPNRCSAQTSKTSVWLNHEMDPGPSWCVDMISMRLYGQRPCQRWAWGPIVRLPHLLWSWGRRNRGKSEEPNQGDGIPTRPGPTASS